METDFLNKNNLKRFLKVYPEKGKIWAINWLRKRKERKELIYAPTHTELRSLLAPTVRYYDYIGGYNKICREVGLIPRFEGELVLTELPESTKIIQDTREQKPLVLDAKVKHKALNVGDYAIAGSKIVVEERV